MSEIHDDTNNFVKNDSNDLAELRKIREMTPDEIAKNLPKDATEKVLNLKKSIDITNSDTISNFGRDIQQKLAEIPQNALDAENSSNKNIGTIGKQLATLSTNLKLGNEQSNKKGLSLFVDKILNKAKRKPYEIRANYAKTGATIDSIGNMLNESNSKLKSDNASLQAMRDDIKAYYTDLQNYIDAGMLTLNDISKNKIPELKKRTRNKNDLIAQDDLRQTYANYTRLSKRVYNLRLIQANAINQLAQISAIQQSNTELSDQINDQIVLAIPAWRALVIQHLALMDSEAADKAVKAAQDTTQSLIQYNTDATVQTLKNVGENANRGVFDEKVLEESHQKLVEAVKDVQKQMQEGNRMRQDAQKRFKNNINDFTKLLNDYDDPTKKLNS